MRYFQRNEDKYNVVHGKASIVVVTYNTYIYDVRSSFVVRRSSFVVRRSPFVVRRSTFVVRRSSLLFIVFVCHLAFVVNVHSWFIDSRWPLADPNPLSGV